MEHAPLLSELTGQWWLIALRGLAAVLFGILAVLWPVATLQLLVVFFGVYALIDGAITLLSAFTRSREDIPKWVLALEGMLGIVAGYVILAWPGVTTLFFISLLSLWAVVTGFVQIVAAFGLRKSMEGGWMLAVIGVVSILFGLLLLRSPLLGAIATLRTLAIFRIIFGALVMAVAFRLRSWGAQPHIAQPFTPRKS